MKRLLLNALTVLSLLGLAAVAALWARSYSRTDRLQAADGETTRIVDSDRGTISYATFRTKADPARYPLRRYSIHAGGFGGVPRQKGRLGFGRSGYTYFTDPSPALPAPVSVEYRIWWLPYWLPALLAAGPGAVWLTTRVRRRRAQRHRPGHCRCCGYDLRATPDKCPECGRAVTDQEESVGLGRRHHWILL